MTIPLTILIIVFLVGFLWHRGRVALIAAIAAFALGALLAPDALVHGAVHTLDGVFRSIQ